MSRRWIVPGVCVGLVVAVAPVVRGDEEPEFLGKKLSAWVKQLQEGKTAKERTQGVLAVEEVGYWNSKDKVLPALVKAMKGDKEAAVQAAAARALGRAIVRAGEIAKEDGKEPPKLGKEVEELGALLKTAKDESVREAAALALGDVGPGAKSAVGALSGALRDKHAGTVRAAATALRKVGKDAKAAESDLVALVADGKADAVARTEAARCLGLTRGDAAAMLPALKGVAADAKAPPGLRRVACETIGKLGKDGVPASEALGAVLVEKVPVKADERARQELAALRLAAVSALDEFGSSAKAALPQIIAAVDDSDRFVRCKALRSIGSMGLSLDKHRDAAWKMLQRATRDTNTEVAVAALDAIGSLSSEGLGAKVDDALKHIDDLIDREGRRAIVDAAKSAREKLRPKKPKG